MISQINSFITHNVFTPVFEKGETIFKPYQGLEKSLDSIKGRVSATPAYTLSKADQAEIKEALKKSQGLLGGDLKKKLKELPVEKIITELLGELDNIVDIDKWLLPALENLDEEKLQELSAHSAEEVASRIPVEKELKDEALKSVLKIKAIGILKEEATKAFYFFDDILNLFIEALGLRDLGARGESNPWRTMRNGGSSFEAKARLDLYMAILLYPSILTTFFVSAVGSIPLAVLFTAITILSTVVFLLCYDRYLKPCPRECTGLTSVTARILQNRHEPLFMRQDICQKVENSFRSRKGVLLVGTSQEGKSTFVTSFAERIVKQQCSDFLRETQVFKCSANNFNKTLSEDTMSFAQIARRFERHEKKAIFFFDEFACFFKNNPNGNQPDKDLCQFQDDYRYVFGATTDKEFDELMDKHKEQMVPILTRFDVIHLHPLTDKEISTSLYETLRYKNPELIDEKGVMDYICQKAFEFMDVKSKFKAAQSLLNCAIIKATEVKFEALENEIAVLASEYNFLKNELMYHSSLDEEKRFKEVSGQLQAKRGELRAKQAELERVKKLESIYLQFHRKSFQTAEKRSDREWLENKAVVTLLEKAIETHKRRLGLPEKLSKALIDSIIEKRSL